MHKMMSMLLKLNIALYMDPCTPMLMVYTNLVNWLALFKPVFLAFSGDGREIATAGDRLL